MAHRVPRLLILSLVLTGCSTLGFDGPFKPVIVNASATQNANGLTSVKRFGFASCNKQYLPQPLWKKILEEKPELFVWTGDVVYADTRDMGKLSNIYASELEQPEYKTFLASRIPVIGVWDDHDYGENDADKSYPQKKPSQQLFLDFIGEPKDSPRRTQDGIYTRYVLGTGAEAVRFIMLDTRSERTSGEKGDMLGSAQWKWLENELKSDTGAVTFIISSIQALPTQQKFEKWANIPSSRDRLIKLIDASPAKNIIILSGDRHFAELSRLKVPSGKTIWEITASGMTHSFRNPDEFRNKNDLRVGPILDRLNYGLIDFDAQKKTVRIQAKDLNRKAIIDQTIPLL